MAADAARAALAQIADEQGLAAARRFAQSHDDDIYLDAWHAIVLHQARLALDSDKRGSTGAARFVAAAAELLPDARSRDDGRAPVTNNILAWNTDIDFDKVHEMLAEIRELEKLSGDAP